jgi:Heterokaryon incompatibility protein (HET)
MRDIFSDALMVISWLGPDKDGEMALAFKAIKTIAWGMKSFPNRLTDLRWLRHYTWLVKKTPHRAFSGSDMQYPAWDAILKLYSNPYFTRVWIIQEATLWRVVRIMSGLNSFNFEHWQFLDSLCKAFLTVDLNTVFEPDLAWALQYWQDRLGACKLAAIKKFRDHVPSRTRSGCDSRLTDFSVDMFGKTVE